MKNSIIWLRKQISIIDSWLSTKEFGLDEEYKLQLIDGALKSLASLVIYEGASTHLLSLCSCEELQICSTRSLPAVVKWYLGWVPE